MVAVPANQVRRPVSLLELIVKRVVLWAKVRGARRGDRPSVVKRVALWVADMFATVAMMASFTYGAFAYGSPLAGFILLGVSFFVVEFKVSMAAWKRDQP